MAVDTGTQTYFFRGVPIAPVANANTPDTGSETYWFRGVPVWPRASVGVSLALGIAIETDAALAARWSKLGAAIGIAAEVDAALAATWTKTYPALGRGLEIDSALGASFTLTTSGRSFVLGDSPKFA